MRPQSSSTFLSSVTVASSLCKCRILRTACQWAGLLWRSFAAKRPSAGEGKEAAPQRTLPGQGDFDTGDPPNPSRLPEMSGGRPPSLWHPLLDLAHRFTPQTDQKTPDFAPSYTSHSLASSGCQNPTGHRTGITGIEKHEAWKNHHKCWPVRLARDLRATIYY